MSRRRQAIKRPVCPGRENIKTRWSSRLVQHRDDLAARRAPRNASSMAVDSISEKNPASNPV